MKFYIETINDSGSGMKYGTKESFLKEISAMIDDCIENGGTFFDATIDSDTSCFAPEKNEVQEEKNETQEKKIAEAISRMKELDIIDDAIQQFKADGTVMRSEHLKFSPETEGFGGLYWLTDEEKQMVAKFEEEHNALVYMVVETQTSFGLHKALLYVSDYEEEWDTDNFEIKAGQIMAYVVNCDAPDCSEFGYIGIKSAGGGLIRTW